MGTERDYLDVMFDDVAILACSSLVYGGKMCDVDTPSDEERTNR
jgi:hypothetical protein